MVNPDSPTSETKLRRAHFAQMLAYVEDSEGAHDTPNWHYGPRPEFVKRHGEIKLWLQAQIDRLERKT